MKLLRIVAITLVAAFFTLSSNTNTEAKTKRSGDEFLWQNHYYGILGKNTQIAAYLSALPDGQIAGSYRYVKNGVPIRLIGKLEPTGEFRLKEISQQTKKKTKIEQETGNITGVIDKSFDTITGTWSSSDGIKSFPISLKKGILHDVYKIDELPVNKGVLIGLGSIQSSEAKQFCVGIGSNMDDVTTRTSCKTESFSRIGAYNGEEFYLGTYKEKFVYSDSSDSSRRYSVIFETSNGKTKPFWFFAERDDGTTLEDVKLIKDKSGTILQVTYNSGGTLPSWSDFILSKTDGSAIIDTDGLEQEVFDVARKRNYETRNSLKYEFSKRRAWNVLYKGSDANCCASAEISLSFEISDNRLVLKNYKITTEQ